MNPVLLKPCSDTGSQVIVMGHPRGQHARGRVRGLQAHGLQGGPHGLRLPGGGPPGRDSGRGGQPGRGQPQGPRHGEHGHGRVRKGQGAAGGATSTVAGCSPPWPEPWTSSASPNGPGWGAMCSTASGATLPCWRALSTTCAWPQARRCWAWCPTCTTWACPKKTR